MALYLDEDDDRLLMALAKAPDPSGCEMLRAAVNKAATAYGEMDWRALEGALLEIEGIVRIVLPAVERINKLRALQEMNTDADPFR